MHKKRQVLRHATINSRAIVATLLAFALLAAVAALAWAAPVVSIDSGPRGPTKDTTPQFDFTVDGSATTVECSIDQGIAAFGPCSGATTHEPLVPLSDGSWFFRVRADDGVDPPTVETQPFSVDTTTSVSIDSGPTGPTRDATPSFGFTAEAGAAVECSVDQGTPDFRSCTSGTAHTAAPLGDGSYTFRVRATDGLGNSDTATQDFSVDTTPPSVSVDSGPTGPTRSTTPSFGFTADGSTTAVECSVDQGTPDFRSCTSGSTHTAAPLGDGSYTFRVRATDGLGNAATATRSFSVDTTAPSLSVDSGPTGPTRSTTPSFGFTAEAGATVECSVDQGTPAYGSCTSGSAHTAATLADGSYTFRVRATDGVGNRATATRSFSVDTTPPSVSVDSGPTGPTSDRTPSLGFTVDGTARTVECSVDQGTPDFRSCTSGTAHTAATLSDGSYTFRVRATDALGNQATATRSFSVDATPPAVGVTSGPSGPTNDRTPSFGFTVDGTARTVECSVDQGTPAYGPCSGAATHEPGAPLADGAYTFRVRAADDLGNRATAEQAFSVDSAAPSLSIESGPAGPTNDSTPSFGFTAAVGATVECSIDQGTPAYGPCTSGTTYVVGVGLSDGTHVFRVRATSGVGNRAIVSRTFTVDTTPPSLSIAFGPSGTTNDSTPLFGFTAEAGAAVACSIDQGTPAYGPCASATTHAAIAPLVDGGYHFRVRAIDGVGNQAVVTRDFTVNTAPPTPDPEPRSPTESPRADPTPPARPSTTPRSTVRRLMSPFPLVRISGTLTPAGVRIRLLSVSAPSGTLVRISVTPPCGGKRRPAGRCRVLQASGTVGRSAVLGFRGLARRYHSGTVIVVRAWRADEIGKYTRFTIVRGKAPKRVDQCLVPAATRGSRCPSA